jgi:hypothetical protein
MRRIGRVMLAAALPLVAGATPVRAQLLGIPVYFNPRGGTGIGVAANLGVPDTHYNYNSGGGTAYGVAGSLGFGRATVTAMVGSWKPKGFAVAVTSYGGDVGIRVFGGGLLPLAVGVQAGYGSVQGNVTLGETQTTIPVGIGVSFDPPLFPLKPWIAPRIELTRVSGGGVTSTTATAFRISAGVNLDLLLGLGVHAGVDWGKVPSKFDPSTPSTLVWGVGAHFNFRVPTM